MISSTEFNRIILYIALFATFFTTLTYAMPAFTCASRGRDWCWTSETMSHNQWVRSGWFSVQEQNTSNIDVKGSIPNVLRRNLVEWQIL